MPMLGFCAALVIGSLAASFTDKAGTKHEWSKAKPTVMISAELAKTLLHMGLPANQLHSFYGGRYTYGSNFGGMDSGDGAHAEVGLNHTHTTPYDPKVWPNDFSDPNDDIAKAFANALDLTPNCRSGEGAVQSGWCTDYTTPEYGDDYTAMFDANTWPDIIFMDGYIWPGFPATLTGNATGKEIPVIHVDDKDNFWNASVPDNGPAHSPRVKDAQEMMRMYHDLAEALGVADVDTLMEEERKEFCEAAKEFKLAAQTAHANGVRAMAANFPTGTKTAAGEIGGYLTTPDFEPMLGLLESLGMPLLHHDSLGYWETMLADDKSGMMSPTDLKSAGTLTEQRVSYPVDFWLVDERNKLDVMSDEFATYWPHPAITADQFDWWPVWTRAHSYQELTRILNEIGAKLKVASKVVEVDTACTTVDASYHHDYTLAEGKHIDHGGYMANTILGPGEYACFQPVTFDFCEGLDAIAAAHGSIVLAAVLLLREFF
jgi:hypothetical protein